MVRIELNNNKIKLSGNMKVLNKVYEDMKIRHPNQWFLRPYMEKGWDGKIKFLSDAGYAKTGLFPLVTSLLEKYNEEYTTIDRRKILEVNEIPYKIGEFTPRDYQIEAVESLIYNEVGDIIFQRGVIGAATNAGKTLIAAMLYRSFKDVKALILVNNTDLYNQFMDDMPSMFGEDWGYMQGTNIRWGNIMVCMTPTLRNRLGEYSTKLASYNMVIFDECHLVNSKTNKKILTALYNTSIRVGLSGTVFAHKDPIKNMEVRAFFGDEVFTISNIELMDAGFSTPIVIKLVEGSTEIKFKGDYGEEYRQAIIQNKQREKISLKRTEFYLKRSIYPILIVGRYHEHIERLYKVYTAKFGQQYKVAYIHHKVKNRKEIIDKFKNGEIDILISSLIIKLGQNMPLIRYMQNAASGDSQINALQLIGRAIRTNKIKTKVYYDDIIDEGYYLTRHSKHRYKYYKNQTFKVILVGDKVRRILNVRKKKRPSSSRKTG